MIPEYFAYLTILISTCAIYSYIKAMIRGNVRPNRISWIFWGIAPLIATYINYKSGVSLPLLASTFFAGFISIPILIVSFFHKQSYWKITRFDILCGIFSALAILIWVTTKNPVMSVTFAIVADIFAGLPTMIKAWKYSDTENATSYLFGIGNQIITFLIITNVSYLSIAFPIYIVLANGIIILGIKRKYFTRPRISEPLG